MIGIWEWGKFNKPHPELTIKKDSVQQNNPDPDVKITEQCELVLVGTDEEEVKFMELYRD